MKVQSLESIEVLDNWLCLQFPDSFPRNLIYFPYVVLRIFFARTVPGARIYVARERYLEIRISLVNLIRSYHILVLDSNFTFFYETIHGAIHFFTFFSLIKNFFDYMFCANCYVSNKIKIYIININM